MFNSRMTDEQLAQVRSQTERDRQNRELARRANGHGSTKAERIKAQKQLENTVGKRAAKGLREAEIQAAGGRPKGIRRFLG